MSTTQDINHDGIDKSVHAYDMLVKMLFEMVQFFVMEVNRFESLFKKFGIDNVKSLSMFFFSFQKIEYILGIFFEKYQNHRHNNTDN